jgi:hypothetical protein
METLKINYKNNSCELYEIGKNMIQTNPHRGITLLTLDIVILIHYFMKVYLEIKRYNQKIYLYTFYTFGHLHS